MKKLSICLCLMLILPAWAQRADKLKKNLQTTIAQANVGRCAVSIIDLQSTERLDINSQEAFPLASVFKVPVMVELTRQMQSQQSSLKLNTSLVMQASDRCIGSGSLQHQPVGSAVSVQKLIELMETRSDNTATDMLFRRIGLTSVDSFMIQAGYKSSQIFLTNRAAWLISLGRSSDFKGLKPRQIAKKWQHMDDNTRLKAVRQTEKENLNLSLSQFQAWEDQSSQVQTSEENTLIATTVDNKLSSFDLASLLAKLYRGQLLNEKWTAYCLGVLSRQTFNTRIPRMLPPGTKVYHKTGTIAGVVNDAGIIEFEPGRALVVVVLIQQVGYGKEAAAERLIAQIASLAYASYR